VGLVGKDRRIVRGDLEAAQQRVGHQRCVWIHITGDLADLSDPWLKTQLDPFMLTLGDAAIPHIRSGVHQVEDALSFLAVVPCQTTPSGYAAIAFVAQEHLLITYSPVAIPIVTHEFENWIRDPHDLGHEVEEVTYNLLDAILSGYFPLVDAFHEELDQLEHRALKSLMFDPSGALKLKRQVLRMRKQVVVIRDNLFRLARTGAPVFALEKSASQINTEGHCDRLMEDIDVVREMMLALLDVQAGSASNRLNHVIRVLTVISTVLMVASVVATLGGLLDMPQMAKFLTSPVAVLAASLVVIVIFKVRKYV
jgi:magnesium transporter